MEQQRNLLFILLLALSLFLYWAWEKDKLDEIRLAEHQAIKTQLQNSLGSSSNNKYVNLTSDVLNLSINLSGGDIEDAKLLKVKQELHKEDPFHLLMKDVDFKYIAVSALTGKDGPEKTKRIYFDASSATMEDNKDSVSISLTATKDDVKYIKTYTLHRNSYIVDLKYTIENNSDKDLYMNLNTRLNQTADIPQNSAAAPFMVAGAYRGSAYSTADIRYEKESFDNIVDRKIENDNISIESKSGWVAMIQHYFVTAWIADTNENITNRFYTTADNKDTEAIIGILTNEQEIKAHSSFDFNTQLWVGPKSQDAMEAVAPNLELTVDYGWLWFISIPLFKILEFIQSFVGNWGFSIILLTLVVRTILFPITKAQYTSMAKMRLLTPKMQELRERYKDDKQKLGQETMRLYKTEKVNPLGGCLPLLIQMPIFIALYWTLMESTELRHAPFILWIEDLSVYDPYFVTPILYGISMYFIQKMSPTPVTDPVQRKVIMAMPFVFTFMFCTFPAGLTVYWLVSNLFTILQQVLIFRSLEKRGLHVKQ